MVSGLLPRGRWWYHPLGGKQSCLQRLGRFPAALGMPLSWSLELLGGWETDEWQLKYRLSCLGSNLGSATKRLSCWADPIISVYLEFSVSKNEKPT